MILVTGANGLNGRALLHLLSAKAVPVRALLRNTARIDGLSSLPKVEIVQGDMARPETLGGPLRGVDRAMFNEFSVRNAAVFRGERPSPK
jgi:uncharacterized protein YbjT (DUF2867 family)